MKTHVQPTVRFATVDDAEHIARLSGQLGYAATTADTLRKLVEISSNVEHAVFGAESSGTLLGWIHVLVSHSLVTDTPAEIAGIVVDEHNRGSGIGRMLMEHAEQWARNKGCNSVRLRSNVVRADAHAFYEKLGYQVTKSQRVFRKGIAA
jgi:GNAT superfamily N-acetyltransferase